MNKIKSLICSVLIKRDIAWLALGIIIMMFSQPALSEAQQSPATMASPANATTLAGTSQTFTWSDVGANLYQIWVGTNPGAADIGMFPPAGTTATVFTVTSLPTNGGTLYVRLWTQFGTSWIFNDYTYTAAGTPTAAAMLTPVNATTLAGASQAFTWTNSGASLYQLWVGTNPGSADIGMFPPAGITATTFTVTGLPTNGGTLYVRLWSKIGTTWIFNDYTYTSTQPAVTYTITASAGANGTISPMGAVSVISGATQTFTMTPNTGYSLSNLSIDGSSVATAGTYTFTNVTANHTINALFTSNSTTINAGIISTDTTWTLAGSPYIVTGLVQVYGTPTTPVTLTIEPGVVVKFNSGASLWIGYSTYQGALVARGTSANRIVFTRTGSSGTWSGIAFNDGTVDNTTVLDYADIQYSTGIAISSASPTIRNSTITNMSGYVSLTSSNPTFESVTIATNGTYGIYGSGSPVISNCTVSIVNTAGNYGLYFTSTSSTLSITNSTIANGLSINTTGILPTITGNTFTNADISPIHAGANIIDQIMDNNTVSGMTAAGKIDVVGETVNRDARWKKWPAPYVVGGWLYVYKDTTTASTLTIDPGVVVKFSAGLAVGSSTGTSKGALVAQGMPGNRITFTRSGSSGNWSTLTFNDGTVDGTTVLENIDIQYSGGIVMNSASPTIRNSTITDVNGYGLTLTSSSPLLDTVTITNSAIYGISMMSSSPTITGGSLTNTYNGGYGIYANYGSPVISNYTVSIVNTAGRYGASFNAHPSLSITNSTITNGFSLTGSNTSVTVTGNTFTNADNSPIHVRASLVSQVMNNNIVTGMTSAGRIEVTGDQISQDSLWKSWLAPYVVSGTVSIYKDTTNASTLTIEPGAVLKFDSGSLNIGLSGGAQKGKLVARGTADNHITFTRSATSGYWGSSLYGSINFFDGAEDGATALEYADIQHAYSVIMTSSSPVIKNSTFTDMTGDGFSLTSSNPVLENVTLSNYGNRSIYLGSSSPTVTSCNLTNTNVNGNGIDGTGTPTITNCTIAVTNTPGRYGVTLSSGSTSSLAITNSTISNGLYIGTTGISPTITGNVINGADLAPVHAGANIIDQIMDNNTVNGMTAAGKIEVAGEVIKRTVRWKNWPAPYSVLGTNIDIYKDNITASSLTIDPGTTVKIAASYRINVGSSTNKGSLIAQGTAAQRIKFTRSGASGTWLGMMFNAGTVNGADSNGTIFENVDIEYSSGIYMYTCTPIFRNSTINDQNSGQALNLSTSNPVLDNVAIVASGTYGINMSSSSPVISGGSLINTNSYGYGIYGSGSPIISNYNISIVNTANKYGIALSTGATSSLSITNSTIGNGLSLNATGIMPAITGNTFTNADSSPLRAGANIIDMILDNNTMTGLTSAGRIEIVGEQVSRDVRWKKWAAPYYFPNGSPYVYRTDGAMAKLTIDPGVTFKINLYGLSIGGYGAASRGMLIAQGTADNKILFTSGQASPAPGNWGGVSIVGNAASASVIENAIFEYGGSGGGSSNANLIFDKASPNIRNCIIRNSAGSGIYMLNATAWPTIIDSEISNNKWGVYSSNANPTIMNTSIKGNTTAGVTNASTTMDLDARGNWWGATTGPTIISNPTGTGDMISAHVLYNPWLGQAPGSGFAFTDTRVHPAALNPDGGYVTFGATISAPANWTIAITYFDAQNNLTTAKTFTGSGSTINQKWFGEDAANAKVADGAFYYHISALNPATGETAMAPLGLFMVSRQIPIANIDLPADNQMFRAGATINVSGTASDPVDFKYYTLEYGAGDNPAYWTSLIWQQIGTTPVTNGLMKVWDASSLTENLYSLRLTVVDNAGNNTVDTARVRFLKIQNAAASNPFFSPNGDGVKDTTTISASITQNSNWTLTIQDASSTVVKTFTGLATSMSQTWDGRNDQGQLVSDGTYTWTLSAVGSGTTTTAYPVSGAVTVDTVMPLAQITSPTTGTVLWNVVPFIGTAYDLNLDSYRIEYSPTGSGGPWLPAALGSVSVPAGPLGTWVTNDATNMVLVANGNYDLRLVASDKAGNSAIASVPVSVNNLILSNVVASSHALNTLTNDTSTISYTINGSATVNVKVIPEKQGAMGTPVRQSAQVISAAGPYSFVWDGKNGSGLVVPDEAYIYVLEASDGIKTDTYIPAAPTGTGAVTCSQSTDSDFAKNLPMTITYAPVQPSRVNISIVWGGQNFKIQDAVAEITGSHSYVWDGRNLNNKLLDVGAKSSCSVASLLGENYIITTGDTIQATDVKTDPYAEQISYGQFTRITYTLPREAYVTVKLTSPSGSTSITLVSNELQAAGPRTQPLEWHGLDATDPTGTKTLIIEEGDYLVSIQTVNPATGTSSTARGSLRIGF